MNFCLLLHWIQFLCGSNFGFFIHKGIIVVVVRSDEKTTPPQWSWMFSLLVDPKVADRPAQYISFVTHSIFTMTSVVISIALLQLHALHFLQNSGRLKLQSNMIVFKNLKTGKVDQLQASDMSATKFMPRAQGHCLKIVTKSGLVHKFDGFRETVSFFDWLLILTLHQQGSALTLVWGLSGCPFAFYFLVFYDKVVLPCIARIKELKRKG